jgi:hypothetical protein
MRTRLFEAARALASAPLWADGLSAVMRRSRPGRSLRGRFRNFRNSAPLRLRVAGGRPGRPPSSAGRAAACPAPASGPSRPRRGPERPSGAATPALLAASPGPGLPPHQCCALWGSGLPAGSAPRTKTAPRRRAPSCGRAPARLAARPGPAPRPPRATCWPSWARDPRQPPSRLCPRPWRPSARAPPASRQARRRHARRRALLRRPRCRPLPRRPPVLPRNLQRHPRRHACLRAWGHSNLLYSSTQH